MPVQNAEIAAIFDQTADLLEIKGENQFRVRAYRRAARTIEGLPQSVRSMLAAEADLSELPGIGKDLAGKIADIVAGAQADGTFRTAVTAEFAAMAFYGAIEQVLTGWIFGLLEEGEDDYDRAKRLVVETICEGLEARPDGTRA